MIDLSQENKYDRQMRVFGALGQKKLSYSKVLLVGADPVGVEAMKNLVLSGVSSICIIDNQLQSSRDLNSFFLTNFNPQLPRGPNLLENLLELNPDVQGQYHNTYNQEIISEYDIILVNELSLDEMQRISELAEKLHKPCIYLHTNGMIGSIFLCANTIFFFDKEKQGQLKELRIKEPLGELKEYFESIDLNTMNGEQLDVIPFPIILYHRTREWLKQGGEKPSFKMVGKKTQVEHFKEFIKQQYEKFYVPDTAPFFNNFKEATEKWDQSFISNADIGNNIQELFEAEPNCYNYDQKLMWQMCKALKLFYQIHNRLPQTNNIPDMESSTEQFLKIKKIYNDIHNQDFIEFKKLFKTECDDSLLLYFLNNSSTIGIINQKTLSQLFKNIFIFDQENLDEDQQENYNFLRALIARLSFAQKNNRFPNNKDHAQYLEEIYKQKSQNDIAKFQDISIEMLMDTKIHTTAAIIGGIAAQEAIKLLTNQFQPLNNWFIYNGIRGTGSQFNF